MKNPGNKPRAGAVRKGRKGPQVGSGGQGRQALEGASRRPRPRIARTTPPASARPRPSGTRRPAASASRVGGSHGSLRASSSRKPKSSDESEMVTGRNSVLEALRAKIPATTLYMAARIEFDDRVKEILQLATSRGHARFSR